DVAGGGGVPAQDLQTVSIDEIAVVVETEAGGPGVETFGSAAEDEVALALDHHVRRTTGGLGGSLSEDPVDGGDLVTEPDLDRVGTADRARPRARPADGLGECLLESDL